MSPVLQTPWDLCWMVRPSGKSEDVGWEAEDDKDSSLACDPSERRRGVHTPRSGLSLFLVRLSCFSLTKLCTSFPTTLSSWAPFVSFEANWMCGGRGGRFSFSKLEAWDCCSVWNIEDWLWRASLFKSMLLIILPLPSRLWFCLGAFAPSIFFTGDVTFCCSKCYIIKQCI